MASVWRWFFSAVNRATWTSTSASGAIPSPARPPSAASVSRPAARSSATGTPFGIRTSLRSATPSERSTGNCALAQATVAYVNGSSSRLCSAIQRARGLPDIDVCSER